MNINLVVWAVPAVAFLTALMMLARQIRFTTSSGLSFEPVRKVKPQTAEPEELLPPARQAPGLELAGADPRRSGSPAAAEPSFDPLSRENFARICSRFGIRVISILPSTRWPRGHGQANAEILVEFEPDARLDYTVVFRLRQELFSIVGRQVDLVCRNSAELKCQGELFANARVLYAA